MAAGQLSPARQVLSADSDNGIYRVARDIFTDPDIFEMEMESIFEGNWVYLAHESQIPNRNDYFTTYIGRQPIVLTRGKDSEIYAFSNACAHRGAIVCREKKGNSRTFSCPFHGWTYKNTGELLRVKNFEKGAYSESFKTAMDNKELSMKAIPRLETYRGFIFASMNEDVDSLEDNLGDSKVFIDIIVDQSPEGVEVLKGSSTYTYNGNWKLQTENGADGYHIGTVHWNYIATLSRRAKMEQEDAIAASPVGNTIGTGGFYSFANGHVVMWAQWDDLESRPIYSQAERLKEEFGHVKAEWMVSRLRNLCLYPNVFLMDQTSTQIRVIRPLAVDKTEVTIYCFAPVGENPTDRAHRIRQYEDFFNASGMATPDDLSEFEHSQIGFAAKLSPWSNISRGATRWTVGADENAKALNIQPVMSGAQVDDEGIYLAQYQHWLELLGKRMQSETDS